MMWPPTFISSRSSNDSAHKHVVFASVADEMLAIGRHAGCHARIHGHGHIAGNRRVASGVVTGHSTLQQSRWLHSGRSAARQKQCIVGCVLTKSKMQRQGAHQRRRPKAGEWCTPARTAAQLVTSHAIISSWHSCIGGHSTTHARSSWQAAACKDWPPACVSRRCRARCSASYVACGTYHCAAGVDRVAHGAHDDGGRARVQACTCSLAAWAHYASWCTATCSMHAPMQTLTPAELTACHAIPCTSPSAATLHVRTSKRALPTCSCSGVPKQSIDLSDVAACHTHGYST